MSRGRGHGIRIAVLDSGVEWSHPDLGGVRVADDLTIIEEDGRLEAVPNDGGDVFGHGTAVAGILHEIAPEAEIGSFRVLDLRNQSQSEMICFGAQLAIERGYHIINCSFGARLKAQVLMFKSWVDRAYLSGSHVVAACNNEDFRKSEWPGDFSSVITVNMLATPERECLFRNQPGTLVEFAALGVNVNVPWKGGIRRDASGSSFAAPRAAALMARMLSIFPHLSPLQAKGLLHQIASGLPAKKRLQLPTALSQNLSD
ncbi:MAG: S8 family serine peptidase [Verrucomicrobium sp.]